MKKAKRKGAVSRRKLPWEPKLKGEVVVPCGSYYQIGDETSLREWVRQEGGELEQKVTARTTILVQLTPWQKAGTQERAATKRNQGGGGIQIVELSALIEMLMPDEDEVCSALALGRSGSRAFNRAMRFRSDPMTVSGMDFRKIDLRHFETHGVIALADCRFDGMDLADFSFVSAKKCSFKNTRAETFTYMIDCDLRNCSVGNIGALSQCDLRGATIREGIYGELKTCDLRKVKAPGARIQDDAIISASIFDGADFSDARIVGATFTKTSLARADFRGAVLIGCRFRDCQTARARGLELWETKGSCGRAVAELERVTAKSRRMQIDAALEVRGVDGSVGFSFDTNYCYQASIYADSGNERFSLDGSGRSLADVARETILRLSATPDLGSIKVKSQKAPLKPAPLKKLVIEAICELCGVEVPAEVEARKMGKARREELQAYLSKRPPDVEAWNAAGANRRKSAGHFRELQLAKAKLPGIVISDLDFSAANLDGANLRGAKLGGTKLAGATLRNANLIGAEGNACVLSGSTLDGAKMQRSDFSSARFDGASLVGANLTGASLCGASLRGTNLKGANLEKVIWWGAEYDESTIFPARFSIPGSLNWCGRGTAPTKKRAAKAKKKSIPAGSEDAFLVAVEDAVKDSHFKSAMKMLRKDKFQLFVEMDKKSLTGIVKSESEPDRTYSCKLASDGTFACCTQNLRPCGGMRGQLCKHLLVLVIGFGKSESRKRKTLEKWVAASVSKKPELDKEAMSETFLRHKGAEAGEIDWRPTETVPEDYYSL